MNLKNQPKEIAYVKIILPRTLLPYKSATGNNKAAVTGSQTDRQTELKSRNGFQRNLVDIVFRSRLACLLISVNICSFKLIQRFAKCITGARKKYGNKAIGMSRGGKIFKGKAAQCAFFPFSISSCSLPTSSLAFTNTL